MYHLYHGKDAYRQREALARLLARQGDPDLLSLNTSRFQGVMPFAEFQQACSAVPFLSPVRLVIVEGLFAASPDKAFMDKLEAFLPMLPETTTLIFLEPGALADNHRLVKLANQKDSNGRVQRFEPLGEVELEKWIRARVAEGGGKISGRAVQMLAANVGNEHLGALGNEIDKLVLYKGPEGEIDLADVTLLSPYAAEASVFDLVDALGSRQGPQAATLFQQKITEGAEPFQLFAMFIRQFRLLIQTKELVEAGERPAGIAAALKTPQFVAEKLARQSRNLSMVQLEQIYGRLLEIDVEVKTGKADLLTAMHLLVGGLVASGQ